MRPVTKMLLNEVILPNVEYSKQVITCESLLLTCNQVIVSVDFGWKRWIWLVEIGGKNTDRWGTFLKVSYWTLYNSLNLWPTLILIIMWQVSIDGDITVKVSAIKGYHQSAEHSVFIPKTQRVEPLVAERHLSLKGKSIR